MKQRQGAQKGKLRLKGEQDVKGREIRQDLTAHTLLCEGEPARQRVGFYDHRKTCCGC